MPTYVNFYRTGCHINHGTQTFCGTPEYMAPEMRAAGLAVEAALKKGKPYRVKIKHDFKVDSWSLGVMLFMMYVSLSTAIPADSTIQQAFGTVSVHEGPGKRHYQRRRRCRHPLAAFPCPSRSFWFVIRSIISSEPWYSNFFFCSIRSNVDVARKRCWQASHCGGRAQPCMVQVTPLSDEGEVKFCRVNLYMLLVLSADVIPLLVVV